MSPYQVQALTEAEVKEFLVKRGTLGKPLRPDHRKIITPEFELTGSFELIARDAKSGEVEWKHEQENLITDFGRQCFYYDQATNIKIGFAPSKETPHILRCGVPTDPNQLVISGNLGTGTITPSTYTKQFSTTFATPASQRTLGIIFTADNSLTAEMANVGPVGMFSYSLLTPPKTQTTTQTIEVIYKISMNPIY